MPKPAVVAFCFLFLTASFGVRAQEPTEPHPVSQFTAISYITLVTCGLAIRVDLYGAEPSAPGYPFPQYTKCRDENKPAVKAKFQGAMKAVAGKPRATELLKDFYASWLTFLDGLVPQSEERKFAYDARVGANQTELSKLSNRIAVELGLDDTSTRPQSKSATATKKAVATPPEPKNPDLTSPPPLPNTKTAQDPFGVTFAETYEGLRVASVVRDRPAYRAGIKAGDIVTHLNGKPLSALYWTNAVKEIVNSGPEIVLTIQRKGDMRIKTDIEPTQQATKKDGQ